MKKVVFDLFEQDKLEKLVHLPLIVEAMNESNQDSLHYIDFNSLEKKFRYLGGKKDLELIFNDLSIVISDFLYFKGNIKSEPITYIDLINYFKYLNKGINIFLNNIFE